jgi:hypothetical protein
MVLTKDILYCMNVLTLAGFVAMGLTLTLNRSGQAVEHRLDCGRTALVFRGLYASGWSN